MLKYHITQNLFINYILIFVSDLTAFSALFISANISLFSIIKNLPLQSEFFFNALPPNFEL